ncbi:glycine zipper 2TM domain-containing protein [Roseibium sp.]|uniref:glycine zipper 2TM domain-containing protein n=1 Tax=Roseibium sp. TaxID=1936156 RepID=UPI003D109111
MSAPKKAGLRIASVGVAALILTGCQGGAPAGVGTVGGAVLGGVVGSAFGSGTGKTAAIIGGSLLGGFIGNRTIDKRRADNYQRRYKQNY